MSTFNGYVSEYPDVAIDRFESSNLSASVFLLSHAHQGGVIKIDFEFNHMVGLDSNAFYETLHHRQAKGQSPSLYCHFITAHFLTRDHRYSRLQPYIRCIELMNEPIHIDLDTTCEQPISSTKKAHKSISLTLFPAGHCAGSVMFLIQGENGTILYTGDFRWSLRDIDQMAVQFRSYQISTVYCDSTFCIEGCERFPTRHDALNECIRLIDKWRCQQPKGHVFMYLSARFGHEWLLEKLCSHYKCNVHVGSSKLNELSVVKQLKTCCTTDETNDNWLHACGYYDTPLDQVDTGNGKKIRLPTCKMIRNERLQRRVLTIKPCVMYFTKMNLNSNSTPMYDFSSEHSCRLQYSCHSSLEEVKRLIHVIRPNKVVPCVVPSGSSISAVMSLIGYGETSESNTQNCTDDTKTAPAKVIPPSVRRLKRLRTAELLQNSNNKGKNVIIKESSDPKQNRCDTSQRTEAYKAIFGDMEL